MVPPAKRAGAAAANATVAASPCLCAARANASDFKRSYVAAASPHLTNCS